MSYSCNQQTACMQTENKFSGFTKNKKTKKKKKKEEKKYNTDEELTRNYRDMVLMNAKNTMDIANEKGRNFKENRNSKTKKKMKRTLLTIRKRPQKLFRHIMKKLGKFIIHRAKQRQEKQSGKQ